MKEKLENLSMRFFSAKTEKRFYTVAIIYGVAFIAIQVTRFILQNL